MVSSSPGANAIPSRPPSPIPVAAATPATSPSRVTLPFGVMRTRRARSRSETSASPLAKKAMPHGTFRSSAIVPATFGVGGPGSAFRLGVRLGLRLALGLGLALALGLSLGFAAPADGTGVLLAVPD